MGMLRSLSQGLPERYYLGVDIGYKEHVVCVIPLSTFAQGDSRWKRQRCLPFASTAKGLAKLQAFLDEFSVQHEQFLGICEPTGGYYGATLFHYLFTQGYAMWMVENHIVKHMREKVFGSLPKTDAMDARVMARICYLHEVIGDEFALRPLRIAPPADRELLTLCRESWHLKQATTRHKNHFSQLMAVVFPELKTFFTKSVTSRAPVALMAAFPSPAEIGSAETAAIRDVLWQVEAYHHAKRAAELKALARASSGLLPDPVRAWRIGWLTDLLLAADKAKRAMDKQIRQQVHQRSEYAFIQSLPYSTETTVGTIIAATGDINRFQNQRQYVAYTGYFPGLETSQTIDRTKMSKRGNRDLKRTYFQIAAMLVWFDPRANHYKQLFERKVEAGRPWYKAMPFVCSALARHVYHCLKYHDPYDVEKAFGTSVLNPVIMQEDEMAETAINERFEAMELANN